MTVFPVQDLCRRHSLEEVAYLRWHGALPTKDQVSAQNRVERGQRALAPRVAAALARQPFDAAPLDTLRTAIGRLGAVGDADDDPAAAARANAVRLFAVLPSIVAADQRRRLGLGPIAPRGHLGYAANLLSMTFGKVPEPQIVAAFETALILYSGGRNDASASADPSLAAGAAIAALQRSPEAGAGPAVLEMVSQIGIPDNAAPWVEDALAAGRKIPGFTDRPTATGDPRVPAMRAALGMIAGLRRGRPLVEVYQALAEAVYAASGRTPLLDCPASLAFRLIGFEDGAFAPLLCVARLPAWTATGQENRPSTGIVRRFQCEPV